jgi:hypothetical protein
MAREGTVMRKQVVLALLTAMFAFGARAARADSIALTSGTLQFYLSALGSADVSGPGFDMSSPATGDFPVGIQPGDRVDFSGGATLSGFGSAVLNGTPLQGNTSGPGFGRLWIFGVINIAAIPFIAPPVSGFNRTFQEPVTLSGFVSGYASTDLSQPPLFSVNLFGSGIASGNYRVVDGDSGPLYLDTCCESIRVTDPSTPSPTPEPASVLLLGTGMIGLLGHHSWRKRRQP